MHVVKKFNKFLSQTNKKYLIVHFWVNSYIQIYSDFGLIYVITWYQKDITIVKLVTGIGFVFYYILLKFEKLISISIDIKFCIRKLIKLLEFQFEFLKF